MHAELHEYIVLKRSNQSETAVHSYQPYQYSGTGLLVFQLSLQERNIMKEPQKHRIIAKNPAANWVGKTSLPTTLGACMGP